MPLTRPAEISDGISLSDKLGRAISVWRFVSEDGTIDAFLSAGIDELPPNKHGVSVSGSKDNLFSRPSEQASLASVLVDVATVVPFVEFEAGDIAILRHVPERFHR
jgi:hypothetical protein